MSLAILRRLRTPLIIETAAAPVLSDAHVDVEPAEPSPTLRRGVVDVEPADEAADFTPDTLLAIIPARVERRPPIQRGLCHHAGHAEIRTGRVGLLVAADGWHATLLPCPYTNRDGR